ncbi:putative ribonuclease H-like domain-containing protein [Tanacetum coccineum]
MSGLSSKIAYYAEFEEVIENGNAPLVTKIVEGGETTFAPSTVEEKAQRRNKPEIDTLSLDDLYKNLKIYEPEVIGTSSSSSNTQNVAFVSSNSTGSTNRAVNTAHGATTASTQDTTVNSTIIDNLSDVVICSFFVSQPNSPQLDSEDLQQIDPDDLEEMDLRWQMAMLTMKARRFLKNTGRKFSMNVQGSKEQENMNRENTRRVVPVDTTTSNALISCVGLGDYDWSDQSEECPTNFAPIAYSFISSTHEGEFVNGLLVSEPIVKKPVVETSEDKASADKLRRPKAVVNTAKPKAVVNVVQGNNVNAVKASACWIWKPKTKVLDHDLQDQGVIDSGCSRHMTGNMSHLTDFEEIDGGYVAIGGNLKGGKITSSATIKTVVIDDYSRFSLVFFLATKDETSGILKSFITGVENLIDQRVKVIRCDNGTEFKNKELNQFCERKSIKREFSVARTPQQNKVSERKNRTLIEAARKMLADSKLPTTFWTKAVNTACYVQNRVLVTKPHNKTLYELFLSRKPTLGFMRPFGCPVTILNTMDHSGKFDGSGPNWLFDIDALTKSMNYKLVIAGNQSDGNAGTKACDDAGKARMETNSKSSSDTRFKPSRDNEKKVTEEPGKEGGDSINVVGKKTSIELLDDPNMPELEDIVYSDDDEDVGAEADMNNLNTFMSVSPIPTTRIHKDHPVEQIIGDLNSPPAPQYKKNDNGIWRTWFWYTQEEWIDYDEVFAPIAKIEAIRLFLAYASFKDFMVYQMDVKSAFLYGKIEEEVYVCQPLGFEDPYFLDSVYKVEKALYGLHQAPKACQDKYVTEILKKFSFTNVKTTRTPMETQKPLLKDEDGEEVDVYLYRSMIGSLTYLTSSRPDIMYLKGQPKLGLWYLKDSSFDLVAYTDSDYAGASLDRKSITGGCQFLGCRLIS